MGDRKVASKEEIKYGQTEVALPFDFILIALLDAALILEPFG